MIETVHIIFMLAYSVCGLAFAHNLYDHLHDEDYDYCGEATAAVYLFSSFLILISVAAYAHS